MPNKPRIFLIRDQSNLIKYWFSLRIYYADPLIRYQGVHANLRGSMHVYKLQSDPAGDDLVL